MTRFTRVLPLPKLRGRFLRGLRFRLMFSFVGFFTLLLVAIGVIFRQNLKVQMEGDVRTALEEDWGAAKGYLRIENDRPIWGTPDTPDDPEETVIIARLQYVHLITDANGNVLTDSAAYESIGVDSENQIRRVLALKEPVFLPPRTDDKGIRYLIKAGVVPDEHRTPYFFALGRSLEETDRTVRNFTRNYFVFLLPGMIALASLLGWAVAGRVLLPLNSVSQAAQNITSANLSMQIPLRGAGDELDHLIDSFNRMTVGLQQSFEQIRRFSTDVSHELRTPLTAIRGQLEVALFTAESPDQFRDAMVNALEDVEKLSSIVRALLLLSQAESGQLVLQKVALNLGDAMSDVVEQFEIPAEAKNLTVQSKVAPGIVISADRTQIERLLANLLSNAVKYTPSGGIIRVRVNREAATGWARLEVEDTGVGIPAENLPHIFDRFYRVRSPETSQIQGLGLGLSFAAWIVEAHGGRVEVESQEGVGTRFTVWLPPLAEESLQNPVIETGPAATKTFTG